MKTLSLSLLAVILGWQPGIGQIPEILWEKQYDMNTSCYFSDAIETEDGGFVIAGAVEGSQSTGADVWLLACSNNGDSLHTRIFNNPGFDVPMKIIAYPGSGYLLASVNIDDDDSYRAMLMAVDADFNELWKKDAGKSSAIVRSDVAADAGGSIWWLNTFAGIEGKNEVSVYNMDGEGNILDEYCLNDKYPAEGYAIRAFPDGSIGITTMCSPAGENSFVQIVKLKHDGTVLWKTPVEVDGKCLTPQCLCCYADNSMLAGGWAGLCYNPDAPADEQIWDYDYLLIKVDEKGKVLWTQNYNREGSEKGTAIAVLPNGNILAGGKCETSFTGSVGPWLMMIDNSGKMINEQLYKFRFVKDQVARIVCTSDGGFLMVGPGYVETENHLSGWVRKFNPVL